MRTLSTARLTIDIVLAGVVALVCLPFALLGNGIDLVVLAGFAAALAVRRLSPAWSLGIGWAAAVLQMVALRDLQPVDVAVIGILYSTAAHGDRVVKWLGLASAGAGALVATIYLALVKPLLADANFVGDVDLIGRTIWIAVLFVAALAVLSLSWVTGLLVRTVRDTRETRRREELATRERELVEYRYIVEQERNRIARDMHDVVAHSLAVIIAQADGGRFASASRPAVATEALGTIAGVARGALGDVRMLLAELRHDEAATPQPALDDLEGLYAQLAAAGLEVEVVSTGQPVPLGTGHEIAVYRIVQEGLTNALRHGDTGRPIELSFAWDDGGVRIELVNAMRDGAAEPPSVRHGVPGMHERAQLAGGVLTAEVSDDRFRVSVRIPRSAGAGSTHGGDS